MAKILCVLYPDPVKGPIDSRLKLDPIRKEYLITQAGELAGAGAKSYTV